MTVERDCYIVHINQFINPLVIRKVPFHHKTVNQHYVRKLTFTIDGFPIYRSHLDDAIAIGAAFAVFAIDGEDVGFVGAGLAVGFEELEDEFDGDALAVELVPGVGGLGTLEGIEVGNKDAVAGEEDGMRGYRARSRSRRAKGRSVISSKDVAP